MHRQASAARDLFPSGKEEGKGRPSARLPDSFRDGGNESAVRVSVLMGRARMRYRRRCLRQSMVTAAMMMIPEKMNCRLVSTPRTVRA